jgi:hypothetical protein
MAHLIEAGRDILGYDGRQFIAADSLKQSVNIGLIGIPHSGKTSCLTFHVAQAVMRGSIVRGWDLHGDVAADLGDVFHILEEVPEILQDCTWIQAERDRRIALRKQARAGDRRAARQWEQTREIFYIVDEFNALMLRLRSNKAERELVTDTLLSLIGEGRKFKMRVVLTGQSMPASLFGEGASGTRDNLSTRYAFRVGPRQAQMLGIEPAAIETLLPLISGEKSPGYAILDGGPLLHAIIVSIPYTTVEDIRALLEECDYDAGGNAEMGETEGNAGNSTETPLYIISRKPETPLSGAKKAVFSGGNAETEPEDQPPAGVTWDQIDQIEQAYKAGWKAKDIAELVHLGGRKYDRFKAACEYLGIDFQAKA